jgi:hypothetical protein
MTSELSGGIRDCSGSDRAHTFSPGLGGSVSKKQRHFGPNPDTETYRVRFLQKTGLIVLEGKAAVRPFRFHNAS